jgi:hypothetical protein
MALEIWRETKGGACEMRLVDQHRTWFAATAKKHRLRALAHAILKAIGDET